MPTDREQTDGDRWCDRKLHGQCDCSERCESPHTLQTFPESIGGYKIIGPLCYQGKKGCTSSICTRMVETLPDGTCKVSPDCRGYHCSYCDAPCSSQGHRCDAANAILGAAEQIAREESA